MEPLDFELVDAAGDISLMKDLLNKGARWSSLVMREIIREKDIDCLKFAIGSRCPADSYAMTGAIKTKNLEIVEICHKAGFHMDQTCVALAARLGAYTIMVYLLENECPCEENATRMAAYYGNYMCLRYLLDHDYPCTEDAYLSAIGSDDFASFELLHSKGIRWNENTAIYAARRGRKRMLEYYKRHGGNWCSEVAIQAAKNGNLDCLRFAIETGCQYGFDCILAASEGGHDEVMAYLQTMLM